MHILVIHVFMYSYAFLVISVWEWLLRMYTILPLYNIFKNNMVNITKKFRTDIHLTNLHQTNFFTTKKLKLVHIWQIYTKLIYLWQIYPLLVNVKIYNQICELNDIDNYKYTSLRFDISFVVGILVCDFYDISRV